MTAGRETGYNIGVVGATGQVGQEFIKILETRNSPDLPVASLRVFASERSAGSKIIFRDEELTIEKGIPHPQQFEGLDFVLTAVGDSETAGYSIAIAKAGALNVDKSNAWRMHPKVPLVVPEVNPQDAKDHSGIIAGPNCSTTQMVVVLSPLHQLNPINKILVVTEQAVSGSGRKGIDELEWQTRTRASGKGRRGTVYPHRIHDNVIPQIGGADIYGNYSEETKMVNETRKILHDQGIEVAATCSRVPVKNGHSESVHVEMSDEMQPDEAREIFRNAPGVKVLDDPKNSKYPTPLFVSGKDDVYVGRIRRTYQSDPKSLSMWIVGDNIRKGAALNAIQVFELVAKNDWIRGLRS